MPTYETRRLTWTINNVSATESNSDCVASVTRTRSTPSDRPVNYDSGSNRSSSRTRMKRWLIDNQSELDNDTEGLLT